MTSSQGYDVCIVGAGPAGLLLALTLSRRGVSVVIVEGGGDGDAHLGAPDGRSDPVGKRYANPSSPTQHLYDLDCTGWLARRHADYGTRSRLRTLGGSGRIWSGWWTPLESADFEASGGFPAWPLKLNDLEQHYRTVTKVFGIADQDFRREQVEVSAELHGCGLRCRSILVNPIDIGDHLTRWCREFLAIDIVESTTVVDFRCSRSSGGYSVEAAQIVDYDGFAQGRRRTISADYFVVAAGALESTRLLLAADLPMKSKHLGHHFVEHPYEWRAARFKVTAELERRAQAIFGGRERSRAQTGKELLALVSDPEAGSGLSFRSIVGGSPEAHGTVNLSWRPPGPNGVVNLHRGRQDALGMPRLQVSGHGAPAFDPARIAAFEATAGVMRALDPLYTEVWAEGGPDAADPNIVPGNHPSGTTRMAERRESGVVDADCRVFDSTNLYVASSSVFPNPGYANPTLTVLALAVRLAEHLAERIRK